MERRTICALSGMLAGPQCPSQIEEWSAIEAPLLPCDWHRQGTGGHVAVVWPAEYRSWARDRGLLSTVDQPHLDGPDRRRSEAGVRVLNPSAGATYRLDPTLRAEFQTLGLRAISAAGGRIDWEVDGQIVGSSASDTRLEWSLVRGAHVIAARDSRGRRAEAAIVVR